MYSPAVYSPTERETYYSIRHITRFRYSAPITESIMETRMQPRSEGAQRCLRFKLLTQPRAHVLSYRDGLSNRVHYFDAPDRHTQLTITAESLVEATHTPPLPDALPPEAWAAVDALAATAVHWDYLVPSERTTPNELLAALAREIGLGRGADPLSTLRALNTAVNAAFDYVPQSTNVDSPIDDALQSRRGVCQDFAHILIALVRELGIPCRYVSGYLFHRLDANDRSAADATHAWVEAFLPDWGWVGFDPTNNLLAGDRHIRVAVGRDYSDAPPTRGVFKGDATTALEVGVQVIVVGPPTPDDLAPLDEPAEAPDPVGAGVYQAPEPEQHAQQQQQQ